MTIFEIAAILVSITAVMSFLNARFIKLPATIGVMLVSLVVSLLVASLGSFHPSFREHAATFLAQIDFNHAVLNGMLAFLLFAGALHLNLADLAREWRLISLLAIFGTVLSTVAIGFTFHIVCGWSGLDVPMIQCMLFGALISPTDPVAVLAILKSVGAPKAIETQMAGESLFNDGIGVVVFLTLLDIASGVHATAAGITLTLLREVGGAVVVGIGTGYATMLLLRRLNEYQTEVLLTLALAMGGYVLAGAVGASGPIAVVIAGLLIGYHGKSSAMSPITREHIDTFWELLDSILNAVLFVLVGMEVLVTPMHRSYLILGAVTIFVALLARWITVGGIVQLARLHRPYEPGTIRVLTWGGLRGGLSLAMALSIPTGVHHDLILAMTYIVVVFSILVQGVSVRSLARRVCTGNS
jgi:CPA1 family monovalent cation:H+ antiporter